MAVTPELTILKTASVTDARVGSKYTYQLNVSNIGDVALFNIFISDPLTSDLKFIAESVTIDGEPKPDESILAGVTIDSLNPNSSSVIKFDVEVLSQPTGKEIKNISLGEFSYTDPDTNTTKYGSVNSNYNTVDISLVNLDIIKKGDKEVVSVGDTVTYTVQLINNGDIDLINITFTDNLPKGLELINGTFTVNGNILNNVSLESGVVMPNIQRGTMITVVYQVMVMSTAGCNVVNEARAKYRYTLPNGDSGTGESKTTINSVYVLKTNISTFKQISIEKYVSLPDGKSDIETINSVIGKVEISKCTTIKTDPSVSTEGQKITNYKLIVQGILDVVIEYTSCKEEQSVSSVHFRIPFSSFIILPMDHVPGTKLDPSSKIEDIYAKNVGCRNIFINTTLLISAKTQNC